MKIKQVMKPLFVLFFILTLHIVIIGCKTQKTTSQSKNLLSTPNQIDPSTKPTHTHNSNLDNSAFEDYNDDPFEDYAENCDLPIQDPLEPWNRVWFHFNDFLYMRIAKPLYNGYEKITPASLRIGVSNFFCNIQASIRVINSILQGKVGEAWVELGKFMVNSTVGLGGFVNVTKKDTPRIPINIQTADFGHTLSKWGFGEGFFIIWPVIGPSTVRDTFGMAGDICMGPFFWFVEPIGIIPALHNTSSSIAFIPKEYGITLDLYLNFNNLNNVLIPYESITKSAIEPYIALRDAYIKFRREKKSLCKIQP